METMAYQDKYETYLDQIAADIEWCRNSGRSHVFGYTSNYDVVFQWDIDVYNQILKEFLKEEPAARAGDTIDTMEESFPFGAGSWGYLCTGGGGAGGAWVPHGGPADG